MSEADIQAILDFRADVQGGLSNASFEMKREMLRLRQPRVETHAGCSRGAPPLGSGAWPSGVAGGWDPRQN